MITEIKKIKEEEKNLRILPMNLEAEQALLASLLTDNKTYEKVSDSVRRNHFYDDINSTVNDLKSFRLNNSQFG